MGDLKIMPLTTVRMPAARTRAGARNTVRERIRLRPRARRAAGPRAPGRSPETAGIAVALPSAGALRVSRDAAWADTAPAPADPVLALACRLEPGREQEIAAAVLARARASASGPGLCAVILDLEAADCLDEAACRAVRSLKEGLSSLGARFGLVLTSAEARQQCADSGLADHLGRDAVHRNLRGAMLAAYASLPGPGLVTGGIRTALERPAEPLSPPPPAPRQETGAAR